MSEQLSADATKQSLAQLGTMVGSGNDQIGGEIN